MIKETTIHYPIRKGARLSLNLTAGGTCALELASGDAVAHLVDDVRAIETVLEDALAQLRHARKRERQASEGSGVRRLPEPQLGILRSIDRSSKKCA